MSKKRHINGVLSMSVIIQQPTTDTNFFPVPVNPIVRNKWFEIAQRRDMPENSNMFCCQDHFDVSIVSSCS